MRYYAIAVTLVVAFMTGFLIPVASDLFVNRRPVMPAAAIAQTTGQRVAVEQSGSSHVKSRHVKKCAFRVTSISLSRARPEKVKRHRSCAKRRAVSSTRWRRMNVTCFVKFLQVNAGWSPSTTISISSISIGNSSSRKVLTSTDR